MIVAARQDRRRGIRIGPALLALLFGFGLVVSPALAKKPVDDADKGKKLGLSPQVGAKLMAAYELFDQGNGDGALEIVNGLANRRKLTPPELAQIHRFRGYIYVDKGQTDKAIGEFEQCLAQHGLEAATERDLIYSLAQLYTSVDKFDKALDLINQWFEASEEPPKPDAYFLKGMILVQQQKYKEAAEPIDKAIELIDKPKESWLTTQGVVYSNLGDYAKLEEILKKLVGMAPQKPQYWTQLAAVQNELKHEHQALATMQLAYQGGLLKDDKALRQLASLLFLQQQPWECAKLINSAMESGVMEKNSNAYRLISNCYIAAREQEKAFGPLTKAGELSPDADMYMLLGQMYLQKEKFDLALEALEKGLPKAKPEQKGSIHLLMGISEIGTEKLDLAEGHFKAALGDQKVGKAAESYLKFIEDKRMRDAQEQAVKEAAAAAAAAEAAEPSEG